MNTQRRTADEQYQLIMECRNSVIPDAPTVMDSKSLETVGTDRTFSSSIEIQSGTVFIRISNDVDPMLLSQIIRCMAGNVC